MTFANVTVPPTEHTKEVSTKSNKADKYDHLDYYRSRNDPGKKRSRDKEEKPTDKREKIHKNKDKKKKHKKHRLERKGEILISSVKCSFSLQYSLACFERPFPEDAKLAFYTFSTLEAAYKQHVSV